MRSDPLFSAIVQLAETSKDFSNVDLEQPFKWRQHGEGVRLALIGTIHELNDLAASLGAQRQAKEIPTTLVQRVLGAGSPRLPRATSHLIARV